MPYTDKFNNTLIVTNTVLLVPKTDTPFLVRIKKLKGNDVLVYDQYSYDGINWNTITETQIKTNLTYKYVL